MDFHSGDAKLDQLINQWLKWDKNPVTLKEVRELISEAKWDELRKIMCSRIKFGTAGLRGKMSAGFKNMNDLIVLQTAQGLCSYFLSQCTKQQLENGVIVGYDGRYNSKRFAELTAKVFVSSSVPVRLFSEICPTPFISFATIFYGGVGGIMVTASHNPKEDNGYKVYWGNGSQIIDPHDDNILKAIMDNLEISDELWDLEGIRSHPLVSDPYEQIMDEYMKYVRESLSREVLDRNEKSKEKIVYSAMHGVGYEAISRAFRIANLKEPICVAEQKEPDPEFSTVRFPNPEETACLALSQRLAERERARLVLCNDPDADRLAVAEFDPSKNEWKIFSGNEMGTLLGWWMLKQYRHINPEVPIEDMYFIASVVSSKMLKSIAQAEGCQYAETLTGFKWMGLDMRIPWFDRLATDHEHVSGKPWVHGPLPAMLCRSKESIHTMLEGFGFKGSNKTLALRARGKAAVFAFEEAIGYMCSARVPDKDGVSAAVQVASLAIALYEENSTLCSQLQQLYSEYGYHVSHNSYYVCHEQETIKRIFERIRNYNGQCQYPEQLGPFKVRSVHDLAAGAKVQRDVAGSGAGDNSGQHDTQLEGTGLDVPYSGGEMVMFECCPLLLTLRTSGTEPKLKYYTELRAPADSHAEQLRVKEELKTIVQGIVEDLLQPKLNGLM